MIQIAVMQFLNPVKMTLTWIVVKNFKVLVKTIQKVATITNQLIQRYKILQKPHQSCNLHQQTQKKDS